MCTYNDITISVTLDLICLHCSVWSSHFSLSCSYLYELVVYIEADILWTCGVVDKYHTESGGKATPPVGHYTMVSEE